MEPLLSRLDAYPLRDITMLEVISPHPWRQQPVLISIYMMPEVSSPRLWRYFTIFMLISSQPRVFVKISRTYVDIHWARALDFWALLGRWWYGCFNKSHFSFKDADIEINSARTAEAGRQAAGMSASFLVRMGGSSFSRDLSWRDSSLPVLHFRYSDIERGGHHGIVCRHARFLFFFVPLYREKVVEIFYQPSASARFLFQLLLILQIIAVICSREIMLMFHIYLKRDITGRRGHALLFCMPFSQKELGKHALVVYIQKCLCAALRCHKFSLRDIFPSRRRRRRFRPLSPELICAFSAPGASRD